MEQQQRHEKDGRLPVYLTPVFLTVFVLMLMLLKSWSAANAHFAEDEAYYRLWGLAPALSYYDHPPMIGWWIWLGQAVLGDTVFAVRAVVILSSALGSLLLWRTAVLLFGRIAAGWSVLFFNTSILIGVGGILATPDAPSVFFWGLSLWALAELQASQKPDWWLAVGFFAGLGLLSKYSVLFLGMGIVLWLILVPAARKWFSSWQLWAGGCLALLCFAPVVYWNHLHDWVSFYKQFGRAGQGTWTTKYIFEFIGALAGLLNPLIAVPAALGMGLLVKRSWRANEAAALVVLTVAPFLIYLLWHSLHARVQANWPAPLFPALALMAAVFIASAKHRAWRHSACAASILGVGVALLVQLHAVTPFTGALARKDPTFQLRGWSEVKSNLAEAAERTDAAFIATTGYGLNGQLSYLFKDSLPVVQLNERIRYVMSASPGVELFQHPGLYVSEERRDNSRHLRAVFEEVDQIAVIPRTVEGTTLENLVVYVVSKPIGNPWLPDL